MIYDLPDACLSLDSCLTTAPGDRQILRVAAVCDAGVFGVQFFLFFFPFPLLLQLLHIQWAIFFLVLWKSLFQRSTNLAPIGAPGGSFLFLA